MLWLMTTFVQRASNISLLGSSYLDALLRRTPPNRLVAIPYSANMSVRWEQVGAVLVGAYMSLALITLAGVVYLVRLHQRRAGEGADRLPKPDLCNSTFDLRWGVAVYRYLPSTDTIQRRRTSMLSYWKRKSLTLLPVCAPREAVSLDLQASSATTPDWLATPLVLPQPVERLHQATTVDDTPHQATGSGTHNVYPSNIVACSLPSVYSTRTSIASSSSTLFEEDGVPCRLGLERPRGARTVPSQAIDRGLRIWWEEASVSYLGNAALTTAAQKESSFYYI
jgi:hypothetical protein